MPPRHRAPSPANLRRALNTSPRTVVEGESASEAARLRRGSARGGRPQPALGARLDRRRFHPRVQANRRGTWCLAPGGNAIGQDDPAIPVGGRDLEGCRRASLLGPCQPPPLTAVLSRGLPFALV